MELEPEQLSSKDYRFFLPNAVTYTQKNKIKLKFFYIKIKTGPLDAFALQMRNCLGANNHSGAACVNNNVYSASSRRKILLSVRLDMYYKS